MMRVRLFYFTPADLLVPRVDRQCIMRFLQALAQQRVDVEAVSLDVRLEYAEPTAQRDLFDVYGLTTRFPVQILPSRTRQSRDVSPAWRTLAYAVWAFRRLLRRRSPATYDVTVLFFKNYLLAVPFRLLRRLARGEVLLLFEAHLPPQHAYERWLLRRMDGVLPISHTLAQELHRHGIDERRILVTHQGVDLEAISRAVGENGDVRQRLGLPSDRKLAVYTGKVIDGYREVDLLVDAARLVPEAEFVIVGGRDDHVERLRERVRRDGPANVRFEGFVAPADVFPYQAAADVLLTYYPSGNPLNRYRSPGKLFEYMASGRPIVTADYPSLREALSPGAAVFVEPDDPAALAAGIRSVLSDPELGDRLARQAREDVRRFTWDERAVQVIEFVERLSGATPRRVQPKVPVDRSSP